MARVILMSVFVCVCALSAAAQEPASSAADSPAPVAVSGGSGATTDAVPAIALPPRKRPAVLAPLYLSYGVLQVMDVATTTAALTGGAGREGNPAMQRVVEHPVAFVAVKAGSTAATIWVSERMWKHNRAAAIAVMAGMNVALAVIVRHNAAVAGIR
jgi:Domain of unknown function (DUF5658)